MAASDKITKPYDTVFGFLGKQYMKTQEEYDKTLSKFYKRIVNHETALPVNPEDDVILYKDEWKEPNGVFKVLEEADRDDEGTVYLANWTDDHGNMYYSCITKEYGGAGSDSDSDMSDGEGGAEVVTRTVPMSDLSKVRPEVMDDQWHVVRLVKEDGTCDYVWESPPQDTMEFMEMYCTWVTRYGDWEPSSDEEGDSEDDDESDDTGSDSDTGSDDEDAATSDAESEASTTDVVK